MNHIITLPFAQGQLWHRTALDCGLKAFIGEAPNSSDMLRVMVRGEESEINLAWSLFSEDFAQRFGD